jgi:ribosomal protein S27AE
MNGFPTRAQVEALRKTYPENTRVELVKMNDPYSKLTAGDRGMVELVDDAGGIHIRWDNGEGLAAIPPEDEIKLIPPTDRFCHRCGSAVYLADNPDYGYQCFACDEDLYEFETYKEGEGNGKG